MNIIYTYRYLLKLANVEKTVMAVHSMTLEQHDKYITQLLEDDNILSAVREYVHEINVDNIYLVDKIKMEEIKE